MTMVMIEPEWDGIAIRAIGASMVPLKRASWDRQAGSTFFKHRRAKYHFDSAVQCLDAMVGKMQGGEGAAYSSYSGPLSEILFFHLDGFLEAERAACDALLRLLVAAGITRPNSPSSMNTFLKGNTKLNPQYPTEPTEVAQLLLEFWSDTGQRAKDYRDCFTHSVTLAGPTWQQAINMRWDGERWHPKVSWPDNPEANSSRKFTFEKDLDAIAVSADIYNETDALLRKIIDICRVKWGAMEHPDEFEYAFTVMNVRIGG